MPPVRDDRPVEVHLLSENEPLPNNSTLDRQRQSVIVNNRFSPASEASESESHMGNMDQRADCDDTASVVCERVELSSIK